MERWRGRTAVVTGASSGIGEVAVRRLAEAGLRVVGLARRMDRLQALEEELAAAGREVKCLECDVTDEDSVESAFLWIEENWGPVCILVNNAGTFQYSKVTDDDFLQKAKLMMAVNYIGLASCTVQALESMKRHSVSDGHIVNVNSVAGHKIVDGDGYMGYSATKHAVTVLSTMMRGEFTRAATGLRVTNLSPGLTRSEISDQLEEYLGPPKFILEPEDVVDALVYALSAPPHVNISEIVIQPIFAPSDQAEGNSV